ncbi:hypothetical protein [Loigolactobacillus zhaoyuanensis]|uniref:WxL domain-containing protein n=1 Tax=Loigolactobacillus zhaoyuanensis TaxID=2486017 RepID=A0ABW8UA70_9LACO
MKFPKVALSLGVLALGASFIHGSPTQAAATNGDSTAQFQLTRGDLATLRLESVPQFEFERVALSTITDPTTIHTPHTVVESVVADNRGHLVVADERTAEARDTSGWQVNAQLNVVALTDGDHELDNVEMLMNFAGNGGSAIINEQASPVWQNKPSGTDVNQEFTRDVDQGRLIIPQQSDNTLAGQYSAHVTWTLTDSIEMQEVDQS